jgi:sulfur-oxidizing protein SoxX
VALLVAAPVLTAQAVEGERPVTVAGTTYTLVDARAIPASLTGRAGDPEAGRRVVAAQALGNCLACHRVDALEDEPFQGDIGPTLDGVAGRRPIGELRLQVVNAKALNPDSVMPAYFAVDRLREVADRYQGVPILTAEQVEDVVAFLATLTD